MTVDMKKEGNDLLLEVEGRVDTTTAPELEEMLHREIGDAETLTIDMGRLDYISSAGLRVLIFAEKTMREKGGMKLTRVNPIIMEIFEITGFSSFLHIEAEEESEA